MAIALGKIVMAPPFPPLGAVDRRQRDQHRLPLPVAPGQSPIFFHTVAAANEAGKAPPTNYSVVVKNRGSPPNSWKWERLGPTALPANRSGIAQVTDKLAIGR